ncbi:DUF1934 domain-containing protein [Tumebacillus permanentifrigoris]|uniref:Uncharacterized beta-barrel protein YwiB (DUF1934 family) n=1 Tax=Tumebacillus permanentifrigoris TaxID=378543 RepID=A0A316DFP5_9BACL|nr:DUF1934 domain-containing protein [Tumebacillus permanentifrigoris]PWK16372.1 uncharacterized beta-barrel protein YwiB (DUF1934 family) [Tumebacillus permanentifrigoris]
MSEKVPVQVSVWSQQRAKSGERLTFRTQVAGTLYEKGEAIYVAYREGEDSGLGQTLTTLRIEGRHVTLIRQGETVMKQSLVKGEEQVGTYKTPHGTFDLVTRTSQLIVNINAKGGRLEALYNLRLAGDKSRMELKIDVKPL